jgi:hypothetical protein
LTVQGCYFPIKEDIPMHSCHQHDRRPFVLFAALFAAMIGIAAPSASNAAAHAESQSVRMEWFGWSFFRFTSPNPLRANASSWACVPYFAVSTWIGLKRCSPNWGVSPRC